MCAPDHVHFRRIPHDVDCDTGCFSKEELRLLQKYGTWLEALANHQLAPETDEQQAFVDVCDGKRTTAKPFELLWRKYQAQRLYERAVAAEGKLSAGGYDYWMVFALFAYAARLGHRDARTWVVDELSRFVDGDGYYRWIDMDSTAPIPLRDATVPPQPWLGIVGSGHFRAHPLRADLDWGDVFDDLDGSYWAQYFDSV